MPSPPFHKAGSAVPLGYFPWEAAGLRWLADAPGGARVVEVLEVDDDHLELTRLETVTPSAAAAEAFGARLAATHLAGAPAHGSPPDGWPGDGWLGPLAEPHPLLLRPVATWGEFFADQRVRPLLQEGLRRGVYDAADRRLFDALADKAAAGDFDTGDAPSRLHGDLWSGNAMWTPDGVVLIDPAAHGGHREADLGMFTLFGAPHLERILAAYDEAAPLADGWRERLHLHQVHPLMLHACLFGGSYVEQSREAARAWV